MAIILSDIPKNKDWSKNAKTCIIPVYHMQIETTGG